MPVNPFVIGQWVRGEKFYGRAVQVEEILRGHRSSIWLLGTRRVGKTSILKQLEYVTSRSADSSYFPIFWDFQGAEDSRELHRGFSDSLLDAEERLERLGIQPGAVEGADLFDSLGRLRRKLRGANLRLLLLCDEVEELIKLHRKDAALLRRLRRVMQSEEDCRSVLASTIRLWALAEERGDTSPFLHGFIPPVYIRGLSDEEARALIRQSNLPSESRPAFDEKAVEEIRLKCDNHPYLIQLVCKRYLELGDLVEAVQQVADEDMVGHFFSVDYEMLSQDERNVLRIIADSSSANSDSIRSQLEVDPGDLNRILLRLEQLGYVRRNAEHRFELVNYFFRKWFRERRDSRLPVSGPPSPPPPVKPDSQKTTRSDEIGPGPFDDRYNLLEEIGKGATGIVYKAFDLELQETIAIKLLKPEYSSNPEILERFRREIRVQRDVLHPHILRVYDIGDHRGQKYLAMKLVEGGTLAGVITREGALPIGRTVDIARKLASALGAAHELKIIHRDIKPQNILVDKKGQPYLTDFGLARQVTAPGMTRTGVFLGTPDYASPEQAKLLPFDERSDLYSLGVVIFEMATGKKPFISDSSRKVLEMHWNLPPPDPKKTRPEIPSALGQVILRLLEKTPARRYPSARALRLALEELGDRF